MRDLSVGKVRVQSMETQRANELTYQKTQDQEYTIGYYQTIVQTIEQFRTPR